MSRGIDYDHCYKILNLRSGASLTEIKQRYRELARQYHPDTVPPAQRERATSLFQQINVAKDLLEAHWQEHATAAPSAVQQRFHDARQRRRETPRQPSPPRWPQREEQPRSARPQRHAPVDTPDAYQDKYRDTTRSTSSTSISLVERAVIVLVSEASIGFILWFGYFFLRDLHTSLLTFQIYTTNDLMLKVGFGFFVFAVIGCSYLTGIALILLAFLLLFVPHETVFRMLSSRRKRFRKSFPTYTRSFSPRRR